MVFLAVLTALNTLGRGAAAAAAVAPSDGAESLQGLSALVVAMMRLMDASIVQKDEDRHRWPHSTTTFSRA